MKTLKTKKKAQFNSRTICGKNRYFSAGLSNIERNKYQPTASTIDKVCKKFKTLIELLAETSKENEIIIENIAVLLTNCQRSKLKKIYEILKILVKI